MLGAEGLHSDAQLHRRVAVDAHKLVVLQLDDIALLSGQKLGNLGQLSGLIRQKHRNRKDPVSLDEAVLDDGGHGDHVHISAA